MFLSYAQSTRAHTTIYFRHMLSLHKYSQTFVFYYYEKKQCGDQSCIGAALIAMLPIIFARLLFFFFFFSNACIKCMY